MKTTKKRTHNPAWKDTTRAARQKKRREALNKAAQVKGWKSWSEYETAIINNQSEVPPR